MARKIIYKNNGLNNQPDSPIGYKFVGYNNDTFSEKDGSIISAIGGSGGGSNIIEKTYLELNIMISNLELDPGQLYLMTDFQTIYDQPDYSNSSTAKVSVVTKIASIDPIVLLATSPNTFAKQVWRPSTPDYILEYDINFNTTEIMAAPAKGMIVSCKDTYNNITGYDHDVVLLKRYESVSGSGVYDSFWDTGFASTEVLTFTGLASGNNLGSSLEPLGFPGFIIPNNTFGAGCRNNTFGDICVNNTFGNGCGNNTFGNDCGNNTFGDYCNYNTFGDICGNNTFGNGCWNNTFGDYCNYNTFGDYCNYNTFGSNCSTNTFGDYCMLNVFQSYINSLDFTASTHVYSFYNCTISSRQDGSFRLTYIDNSDVQIIVNATA